MKLKNKSQMVFFLYLRNVAIYSAIVILFKLKRMHPQCPLVVMKIFVFSYHTW